MALGMAASIPSSPAFPSAGAPKRLAYRAEIDGLRALAILPVMGFHAGLPGFEGGYLGVDVFFVISGYLITSLIVMESEEGRFSLAGFWARRARRILPLLTLVILACLPAAWWLLAWRDITDFWQSLIAISLFASNILFWSEGTYFGVQSELKPLLHTWSLAVEEQFYLIFPILCAAALKWAPQRLRALFWFACGLSAALFLVWQIVASSTAFFWLPARAWQLLTGSLCALALMRQSVAAKRHGSSRAKERGFALGGLALIILAMALAAMVPANLGLAPLLATVGAALVVRFAQAGSFVAKGLSWRPLVAVGLVSYGAYLWHVPLLVFARHAVAASADPELDRVVALPLGLALALCALSLLLAALTWRWVEQPFRDRARVSGRAALALGAASLALILAFALTTARTDWQEQAYLTQTLGAEPQAAREFLHQMQHGAVRPDIAARANPEKRPCVMLVRWMGEEERQRIAQCHARHGKGVLLFGDSHAQGLHFVLAGHLRSDAFFVTVASPGCRMDNDRCFTTKLEEALSGPLAGMFASALYSEAGSARILNAQGRPDRQTAFTDPSSARIATDRLDVLFERLSDLQERIDAPLRIVGPHYEPRINLKTAQPLFTSWVPRPTVRGQFEALDTAYAARARSAGLDYISMMTIGPLSPDDRVLHDGCLIYFDLDHFSVCGSKRLAQRLRALDHPLMEYAGAAP